MQSDDPSKTAVQNHLWAAGILEELYRLGIRHACVSPGSRCTPLTLAAANHPAIQVHRHFDERGGGFLALGLAKATGTPTVLICTSGSAVANYLPAAVEASMDQIPLLILSADRPPELQGIGANQTIPQAGIYSHYVRTEYTLPCPDSGAPLAEMLATIDRVVRVAQTHPYGPVHLNIPFREPFFSEPPMYLPKAPVAWDEDNAPYAITTPSSETVTENEYADLCSRVKNAGKGVIVIGALRESNDIDAARRILKTLAWPAFIDIQSQLRLDASALNRIRHHHILLNSELGPAVPSPDIVLWLGGRVTSRHLDQWLQRQAKQKLLQLRPHGPAVRDGHRGTLFLEGPLSPLADSLESQGHSTGSGLLPGFMELDEKFESLYQLRRPDLSLSGPQIARTIASAVRPGCLLFLANSLTIREFDEFAEAREEALAGIVCNRGASGIDGNLATAIGAARGSGRGLVAVLGDLALLHDLNSLALMKETLPGVTLVVINNNGGGIFERLPIAGQSEHFESCFRTPHNLSGFEMAAAQFELPYTRITDLDDLAYALCHPDPRSSVLEIATDAKADEAWRQELYRQIRHRNLI